MQFGYGLVLAAIVLPAVAQESFDYPRCSVSCLRETLPEIGCSLPDIACQCGPARQDALRLLIRPCLEDACDAEARSRLWTVMNETCASYFATSTRPVSWPTETVSSEPGSSADGLGTPVVGGSSVVASEPPTAATEAPEETAWDDDVGDDGDHDDESAAAATSIALAVTAIALFMGVAMGL
ncbi:hypothetical protein SODALDRAFT_83760 [Sodiomyces alkalinus F11]|uniref:CFEM domain-containing protein n=1 Tax=Sodiomyces alkalinus (strain CBS 110278 / VKM F-3762 / F11) TaxID=1314773 RepID=A0A3N2PJL7_SODAK|nr:hypothetical protein SODALDRAFT_83760 [Sodiomyces alkalinus F11]ROT34713.1 hypothetical protein SODALDRAFT_83760 [Sodiomyces alkalinus F11]